MTITSENYQNYITNEILTSNRYVESDKSLSFSLRNNETDDVVGYISLKKEKSPIILPNICDQAKGCCILDIYVEKVRSTCGLSVVNTAILYRIFEETEFCVTIWVESNGENSFDYIWFDISSFESEDLISILVDLKKLRRIGNIVYIPI